MTTAEIEHRRLNDICQRLEVWRKDPTLSVSAVVRLTGLSRTRIEYLIERGSFQHGRQTENREVLLGTILQYFSRRVSMLSKAGKFRCKELPKLQNRKLLLPTRALSATKVQ
jgi:hypothetical protein